MEKRTLKIIYAYLGALIFCGFLVGLGFILNTFWKMNKGTTILFWITTGLVCFFMLLFVTMITLTKRDKGALGIQLFFTSCLGILPLVVRLLGLIPYAGVTIAGILAFIVVAIYLITMLSMAHYNTVEENKNTWVEPKGSDK